MADSEAFAAAYVRGPDETDQQYRDRVITAIGALAKELGPQPGAVKPAMISDDEFVSTFESGETP